LSLGGRPKEEGGHKPLKISVNKFMSEALEKVDNKSRFIEKAVTPLLKQLDPAEASVVFWHIDAYIKQEAIKAIKKGNYQLASALSWMAYRFEDERKLCGIPPSTLKTASLKNSKVKKVLLSIRDKLSSLTESPSEALVRKGLI
jgi:hypothetical protein